jgi:hypothetical protein
MSTIEERINSEVQKKLDNCKKISSFDFKIQTIDNITIIRDDLLCGGTKSRFLHLVPTDYSEYIYVSNPYGGLGLALATKFGSKVTVFVDEYALGPLARIATGLGAKYYYVTTTIDQHARAYVQANPNRFLVPNGLDLPGVNEYIKNMGNYLGENLGQFDMAFIPCGSGTLCRGLAESKLAKEYRAICVAGGCSPVGNTKCIKHYLSVNEAVAIDKIPPYQSTMYYDAKVWEYAKLYADKNKNKRVLIWNVL